MKTKRFDSVNGLFITSLHEDSAVRWRSAAGASATRSSRGIVARLVGGVGLVQGTWLQRRKPAGDTIRVGSFSGAEGATSCRAGENGCDESAEGDELNHTAEGEHRGRVCTRKELRLHKEVRADTDDLWMRTPFRQMS